MSRRLEGWKQSLSAALCCALLAACTSSSPTPRVGLGGVFDGLATETGSEPAQKPVETAQAIPTDGAEQADSETSAENATTALALADTESSSEGAQKVLAETARSDEQTEATKVDGNSVSQDPLLAAAKEADKVPTADNSAKKPEQPATDIAKDDTTTASEVVSAEAKPEPQTKKQSGSFFASLFKPSSSSKTPNFGTPNKARVKPAVKRPRQSVKIPVGTSKSGLPGVRLSDLFGISKEKRNRDELKRELQLASVTSMARRGNFGLLLQTPKVRVDCFPARLVAVLKQVERHYGRTPIVTSGYRSRERNRRIRGARNSTHISCAAADIQVQGVSKWQLAKYLRSLPDRGGVGTYCHTNSVHIDIGKRRDWNWRCRRKRRRA